MNTLIKAALICTSIFLPALVNAGDKRFYDYARVQQVTPVYRTTERRVPVENCWIERVRNEHHHRGHTSATGTLVGGVIGGAIGHSVGHGRSNKKLGAVIGSVIGMSVAHDVAQRKRRSNHYEVSYQDVERCDVSYRSETEQIPDGYQVRYSYRGETFSTHMDKRPGKRIKVAVRVRPVKGY